MIKNKNTREAARWMLDGMVDGCQMYARCMLDGMLDGLLDVCQMDVR